MSREVVWHEAAERVFKAEFPAGLQDAFIRALKQIAVYEVPALASTRHGLPFDNAVWKLKAKDEAGQWRVVYVKGYTEAVYVVNAYCRASVLLTPLRP